MKWSKLVGVITLCILLTGCSGYSRYGGTAFINGPPVTDGGTRVLTVGQKVKVETSDGIVLKGPVEAVTDTSLVVAAQDIPFARAEVIWVKSTLWAPTLAVLATSAWVYNMASSSAGIFAHNNSKTP